MTEYENEFPRPDRSPSTQKQLSSWVIRILVFFALLLVGSLAGLAGGYFSGGWVYDCFPGYFDAKYAQNFPAHLSSKIRGCAILEVSVLGAVAGMLVFGAVGGFVVFAQKVRPVDAATRT